MSEPRTARPTISFIDGYCASYRTLFSDVRSFEAFTHLHIGMLSPIPRKTLPAIAQVVGLQNEQSLHHFLAESPVRAQQLRSQRLKLTLQWLKGKKIYVIIDETGDKKRGSRTDYVSRQYLGKLGKLDNGIVAVTAWGLIEHITFPLLFEVYKPKQRLKPGDVYHSKPQIAAELLRQIKQMGFEIELVLADSLYGESETTFLRCLQELKLNFIVAIRENHGVWLPKGQRVRHNKWRSFNRVFSEGTQEVRFVREIVFGKRTPRRYWEVTTDPETLPKNSTSYVMTEIPSVSYQEVGNLYGCRNWVEYALNMSKNELGWADFRLTRYETIEKWWEVVSSAYLLVSLYMTPRKGSAPSPRKTHERDVSSRPVGERVLELLVQHPDWDLGPGWKNILNNLRLISQPFLAFNEISSWLKVFPIPQLSLGFPRLISLMNFYPSPILECQGDRDFLFDSA